MSKNQALKQIKSYLDKRAKEDELFANMYAKKDKNINSCFSYIIEVAKKRGNAVCMTDEEVYGLAVHYYCEDDLKVMIRLYYFHRLVYVWWSSFYDYCQVEFHQFFQLRILCLERILRWLHRFDCL